MTVVAIGLNHRNAPASVLSSVAIPADRLAKALFELLGSDCVNEAVVISTCNRTEMYVDAERFHDGYHDVRDALGVITGTPVDRFVEYLDVRYDTEAVMHLFELTAGLDSAILGEHEILGQVRRAWDTARTEGASGVVLDPLFDHALRSGKRVRTNTGIGRHTTSLAQAAVHLVRQHRPNLDGSRVLLVGTGEAGAGVASALARVGDIELTLTNRTRARADQTVRELPVGTRASVVDFDALPDALKRADVIISATASPATIIDSTHLGPACPDAQLFLDLAMPADIHPEVGSQPGCRVLTLADLNQLANQGIERRRLEADAARALLVQAVADYRQAVSVVEVAPLLGSMHRWGESVRSSEIDRYRNRLGQLDPQQLDAVEALTKAVVAKMLHQPSVELRRSAGTPRGERLAEAARELFGPP